MRHSIRARITALATAVVAVVLVLTATALVTAQRRILTANLDESLATYAAEIADRAENGAPAGRLPARVDDDAVAQIVTPDGRVIGTTSNLASLPPLPAPAGSSVQRRSGELPDGESSYRIVSQRFGGGGVRGESRPSDAPSSTREAGGPPIGLVVHTAAPLDDIEESIAALWLGLLIAIPIVVLVLAVLIWLMVGRTLEPVEAMRREVADISSRNLDRRVPIPRSDDEIGRLALTMNAMLDRVERSVARQRSFVADASHELRTPLTRMRSELEVDLRHPGTADLAATHRSILDEIVDLEELVTDLMVLARLDADDNSERGTVCVDVDDLVLAEAGRLRATTALTIDTSGVSAAQVDGAPAHLARVLRNLLDNAARHAYSTIEITLTELGGRVVLTVSDDGPGVPRDQRDAIFERFTRADDARAPAEGGAGLGLAIARDLVERHGGTVRVDATYLTGARFVVDLPAAALPMPQGTP